MNASRIAAITPSGLPSRSSCLMPASTVAEIALDAGAPPARAAADRRAGARDSIPRALRRGARARRPTGPADRARAAGSPARAQAARHRPCRRRAASASGGAARGADRAQWRSPVASSNTTSCTNAPHVASRSAVSARCCVSAIHSSLCGARLGRAEVRAPDEAHEPLELEGAIVIINRAVDVRRERAEQGGAMRGEERLRASRAGRLLWAWSVIHAPRALPTPCSQSA